MARVEVPLFFSHVCDDHPLIRDTVQTLRLDEQRGGFPAIVPMFGCPDLSGQPAGTSVRDTWKRRIDDSRATVFFWTRNAPHSAGTAAEWTYESSKHRRLCLAVEEGATLPASVDGDAKRIALPVEVGFRGIWLGPRHQKPVNRYLMQFGDRPPKFRSELRAFANSLLTPLV